MSEILDRGLKEFALGFLAVKFFTA
jgi:hypothetical protein